MFVQITNAGAQILNDTGVPWTLSLYKLGDEFGYTPAPTDVDIRGQMMWSGVPSVYEELGPSVVRYSIYMDRSVGDFGYGEFGLYVGTNLVALGTGSTLVSKRRTITGQPTSGNSQRLDVYLSMVDQSYSMWINVGDSAIPFVVPTVINVDQLPRTNETATNHFIVGYPGDTDQSFAAYTDRSGLWVFDSYRWGTTIGQEFTVVSATSTSVTISGINRLEDLDPQELGDKIVQFTSGPVYGTPRNIGVATPSLADNTTTIGFVTPLAIVPLPGDTFRVYGRDPVSSTNITIPIATRNQLGIMRVGDGLAVSSGLVSVDRETVKDGLVWALRGYELDGTPVWRQGNVVLNARDVGAVATVNGQPPDNNGNVQVTVSYTLPGASNTILGGVRVSPGSGLVIDPSTYQLSVEAPLDPAVTTVNQVAPDLDGNVQIYGLIQPKELPANANLDADAYKATGLYWCASSGSSMSNAPPFVRRPAVFEVIPYHNGTNATGACIQRWTQDDQIAWRRFDGTTWSAWAYPGSNVVIATTTNLGSVMIGQGLNVLPDGLLSANLRTVNSKAPVGGDVTLDADDVGAIPVEEKGEPGGVATLDKDPQDPPTDPASPYLWGRIPKDQLSIGAWTSTAEWDAQANQATTGVGATLRSYRLLPLGRIELTDSTGTIEVPGDGLVFRAKTSGTTDLDGFTDWQIGDLAIGFLDRWVKLRPQGNNQTSYQLAMSFPTTLDPAEIIYFLTFTENLSWGPSSFSGAHALVPPSDDVTLDIEIDGANVGGIFFESGSSVGVITATSVVIAPGQYVMVRTPGSTHGLGMVSIVLNFGLI